MRCNNKQIVNNKGDLAYLEEWHQGQDEKGTERKSRLNHCESDKKVVELEDWTMEHMS